MKSVLKFIENFYLSVVYDKTLIQSFLETKELAPLRIDIQKKILDVTIKNPYCKIYAPPISYQKFFLRTLLGAVEENECELSDGLIEAYANVLAMSTTTDCFYRSYIIQDDCVITLQESSCFVVNGTTGLQTWEASKYLLEWCFNNIPVLKNKKILELGCGVGLLGIGIVKVCQPLKYIFSDKSLDVLNYLTKNIEINLENDIIKEMIQKHQLPWGNLNIDDVSQLNVDVIVGADIVFDPTIIEDLVKALKIFLVYGGISCAYIASTIRNAETTKYFTTQLDSAELVYEVIDFEKKLLFIYNKTSKFILYKIFLINK